MDEAELRQDKLTPEEIDSQLAELPDREALSLVNLGMPLGTPTPVETAYHGRPEIGPPTIDPPSEE